MPCCCHVPMKPGCSALGGLVLNCMELSPAPSALLLTMLMPPKPLLLLVLLLLLLWALDGMLGQTPAVAGGPLLALAGGGPGGSGSALGSRGTVSSHSLPLTSNSASLDLDRERERGRAGGMGECEGGEKRRGKKVSEGGLFGVGSRAGPASPKG